MAQEEFQDIVTYTPKIIKTIQDDEVAKYIMDPLYFPIIKVLREGPMTVKEIEKAYNEEANQSKSDKTIYRYLKNLQEADLVVQAGQRVVIGKTATETLFSRTAYGFYVRHDLADFWKTENGKKLALAIGSALSPVVDNREPNVEKLQNYFYDLSIKRMNKLEDVLQTMDVQKLQDISDLDWRKFTVFYNLGGLFAVLLNDPKLLDELRDCFD